MGRGSHSICIFVSWQNVTNTLLSPPRSQDSQKHINPKDFFFFWCRDAKDNAARDSFASSKWLFYFLKN